jgi:hypothetical protein
MGGVGGAEGAEKMNVEPSRRTGSIERPTSNFEWEKMKKLLKVERKKLGRWEDGKKAGVRDGERGRRGESEGGIGNLASGYFEYLDKLSRS